MNATSPPRNEDVEKGTSSWNDAIGPFYDEAGVRALLGNRFATDGLLVVVTGDGGKVFPFWQFDTVGAPLPHLAEVLAALRSDGEDTWGEALWLRTPSTAFGGRSASDLLRAGEFQAVLAEAKRDAARRSR